MQRSRKKCCLWHEVGTKALHNMFEFLISLFQVWLTTHRLLSSNLEFSRVWTIDFINWGSFLRECMLGHFQLCEDTSRVTGWLVWNQLVQGGAGRNAVDCDHLWPYLMKLELLRGLYHGNLVIAGIFSHKTGTSLVATTWDHLKMAVEWVFPFLFNFIEI